MGWLALIRNFLTMESRIMSKLDDIKAAVEAETTVINSAVTLLQGLKAKLDEAIANGLDPAEVQAISDEIGAHTQALADAVAANTPSG